MLGLLLKSSALQEQPYGVRNKQEEHVKRERGIEFVIAIAIAALAFKIGACL